MILKGIDLARLESPILLRGDFETAYRDPAVLYHEGIFYLFHSLVRKESDGVYFWYIGLSKSEDLIDWTEPEALTPRDQYLNFSSPGSVVRAGEEWVLCMQTYPTPHGMVHAGDDARIWITRSRDLETWSGPEILLVEGPGVPMERMGRSIDAFLVGDRDEAGKWWCFYKYRQEGIRFAWSGDLLTWTPFGRVEAGENPCVVMDGADYVLFHSPGNGIGVMRSPDLVEWRDAGRITLGQTRWSWAEGRLTAGFVLDLRHDPGIGKYLLFFHGSSKEGKEQWRAHGAASIGVAWSDDLVDWNWPGRR